MVQVTKYVCGICRQENPDLVPWLDVPKSYGSTRRRSYTEASETRPVSLTLHGQLSHTRMADHPYNGVAVALLSSIAPLPLPFQPAVRHSLVSR